MPPLDAQISALVSEVLDEMEAAPVGTTVGEVLRRRARGGDPLAAVVLEDAEEDFLTSMIAPRAGEDERK